MVCIGEIARTYDGHVGTVLRKLRGVGNEVTIHIRERTGNIHVCLERMVQECNGDPQCEIKIIRSLIDELELLRRESIENIDLIQSLLRDVNTYKGYLYSNQIQ